MFCGLLRTYVHMSWTEYIVWMEALRIQNMAVISPVSIQTQSLALRALRKRKPQETQATAFEWKPGYRRDIGGPIDIDNDSWTS